jgi:hypothetical protein
MGAWRADAEAERDQKDGEREEVGEQPAGQRQVAAGAEAVGEDRGQVEA